MSTKSFYAGIGSRDTPEAILNKMNRLAIMLQQNDWWLRSGGASGADTAFERGAGVRCEIFRKEDAEGDEAALALARKYHHRWDRCSYTARLLHARNGYIILGKELGTPVSFVLCWTRGGLAAGGTGQGLRIAADWKIPIFNLYHEKAEDHLLSYLTSMVW